MSRKSFVLAAFLACASLRGADYKFVERTVPLDPTGTVSIETRNGSIEVLAWDRPEVAIRARIELTGRSLEDRHRFDQTGVGIDSLSDSIRIRSKYPQGNCCSEETGQNPLVHYTIRMPRTAGLTIRDHASRTDVQGLEGALDLHTHRGDVRIDFAGFTRSSTIATHRGSVELLLPRDSRFGIAAESDRRGSIESDFTIMARMVHKRGAGIEGAVNGGGPRLRLSTDRGRILVRAK